MSVEKLERVMWRIRTRNPDKTRITNEELRRAIMLEIGTDPRTLWANRKSLITLQWIKTQGKRAVELTGKDLTD